MLRERRWGSRMMDRVMEGAAGKVRAGCKGTRKRVVFRMIMKKPMEISVKNVGPSLKSKK